MTVDAVIKLGSFRAAVYVSDIPNGVAAWGVRGGVREYGNGI